MSVDRIINSTDDLTTLASPKGGKPNLMSEIKTGSGATAFDRIRDGIADARGHATLQPGFESLLSEGMADDEYLDFLYDLYHIVWHFCPVMAAAASRCTDEYKDLRYALYHQIDDEKGHEDYVLEDIVAMGGDADRARKSEPTIPIQALIGFNYHAASSGNPWGAMGMVHVLEETAATYAVRVARVSAERMGRSQETGFKFLLSHGEMDQEHVTEFQELVEEAARPQDIAAIVSAGRVNYALFYSLFRDF